MKIIHIFQFFQLVIVILIIDSTSANLPEPSILEYRLDKENNVIQFPITLLEKTKLNVGIFCESTTRNSTSVTIEYKFTERICKGDNTSIDDPGIYQKEIHPCTKWSTPINLKKIKFKDDKSPTKPQPSVKSDQSILTIVKDGIYVLQFEMSSTDDFNASLIFKFVGPDGFLTAKDEPMLHFYAFMCIFYMTLALIWTVFSVLHWNSLLRIQFWIMAVILLGLLEKACFYFEYHQANEYGYASLKLALIAEIVSCVKRTLSRILVLIVSMGFGITKSRLGDEANVRITVISVLYFIMASIESYLRLIQSQYNDESKQLILAAVPLALIDSLICWWIFTSLISTIRALKLRRIVVKLDFYRHFQNVLIFGVGMSVIFMLYSIRMHKVTECAWKNLYIDYAFWHVLFSILLSVIAFLWRPNQNNQKYAFVPSMDDDGEQEDFLPSARFSDTKLRLKSNQNSVPSEEEDETIRWVEENIASASFAGGLLDDEEELINTKFEISKMQ